MNDATSTVMETILVIIDKHEYFFAFKAKINYAGSIDEWCEESFNSTIHHSHLVNMNNMKAAVIATPSTSSNRTYITSGVGNGCTLRNMPHKALEELMMDNFWGKDHYTEQKIKSTIESEIKDSCCEMTW